MALTSQVLKLFWHFLYGNGTCSSQNHVLVVLWLANNFESQRCLLTRDPSHVLLRMCSFARDPSHVLLHMCSFIRALSHVLLHMCSFTRAPLHVLLRT
jgi:hypothetical protein